MVTDIKIKVKADERRVLNALHDQSEVVFGGLLVGATHCIAPFATLTVTNVAGYRHVQVRVATVENEQTQDTMKQFSHVSYALEVYSGTFDSVTAIIGDNT